MAPRGERMQEETLEIKKKKNCGPWYQKRELKEKNATEMSKGFMVESSLEY